MSAAGDVKSQDSAEAQVRDAETRRCRALVKGDVETVGSLMREDMVHVHATGISDDKATYINGVTNRLRFERANRVDLKVRVFGDTAVATGTLDQVVVNQETDKRIEAIFTTTQVWVKENGKWSQASFHASRPQ